MLRFFLVSFLLLLVSSVFGGEPPLLSSGARSHWREGAKPEKKDLPPALSGFTNISECQLSSLDLSLIKKFRFCDPVILDRASKLLLPIYKEMSVSKTGFAELEPVYPWGLGKMLDEKFRVPLGHFYTYVPQTVSENAPIVLFLHGAGPNLAVYLWRMKELTLDQAVIICPTSDSLWWNDPNIQFIADVLSDVQSRIPNGRQRRVVITGMSRGGIGALAFALKKPELCHQVIAISAAASVLDSSRFFPAILQKMNAQQFSSFDISFVHGQDDDTIWPLHAFQQFSDFGCQTSLHIEKKRDHFLFLDRDSLIVERAFESFNLRPKTVSP